MAENEIITRTDFAGFDQARITELELAAEMTVLGQRINAPYGRGMVGALSANGRWGYEREGRAWVIIDKTERESLIFESSLAAARRRTFEIDHPVHTVPTEPRPMRFTVA